MKYYKTNNGKRAIGEKGDNSGLGDQSKLVQKDWVEISYDEMLAITNPPKSTEEIEEIRVNEINNKARTIIYSKYPLEKQSSAQLGVYGDEYLVTMKLFIKQVIDISNEAIDTGTPAEDVDFSNES